MVLLPNGVDLAFYYFGYVPNRSANFAALAIFAVLFILLVIRVRMHHSPRFFYFLPYTALFEIVGFTLRYLCSKNPNVSMFTVMNIFLLISANILILVNYKTLGDIASASGVKRRFGVIGSGLTKRFFATNIFATIFQIVGGSLISVPGQAGTAKILGLVGLSLQVVFFTAFILCVFYIRNHNEYNYYINDVNPKKKVTAVIIASMLTILARQIYRLQNAVAIYNGHQDPEWVFYVFDSLLIAISLIIHFVFFVGNSLPVTENKNETTEQSFA